MKGVVSCSTEESFLEKKYKGAQEPSISCWRTAPTWEPDESTEKEILVVGSV